MKPSISLMAVSAVAVAQLAPAAAIPGTSERSLAAQALTAINPTARDSSLQLRRLDVDVSGSEAAGSQAELLPRVNGLVDVGKGLFQSAGEVATQIGHATDSSGLASASSRSGVQSSALTPSVQRKLPAPPRSWNERLTLSLFDRNAPNPETDLPYSPPSTFSPAAFGRTAQPSPQLNSVEIVHSQQSPSGILPSRISLETQVGRETSNGETEEMAVEQTAAHPNSKAVKRKNKTVKRVVSSQGPRGLERRLTKLHREKQRIEALINGQNCYLAQIPLTGAQLVQKVNTISEPAAVLQNSRLHKLTEINGEIQETERKLSTLRFN